MMLSALSFAVMASFVKYSTHSVAVNAFSRQAFSLVFILLIMILLNVRIVPLKKNRIKLFLRCIFGAIGIYLYFYSIENLLLANASMLTRLSPFFVTLFASIILKESISRANWIIFIPMLIGCMLIIKPNTELFHPASIFAVLSAISGALAYTMISAIGKEESPYTIIFWFTLISSILYALIIGKEFNNLYNIEYFKLIMIGLFGVLGQIGLTFSYQLSRASDIAPYSYLYILFSGLIGYQIWNEIPDFTSIIGYFLIIGSYYFLIKLKANIG